MKTSKTVVSTNRIRRLIAAGVAVSALALACPGTKAANVNVSLDPSLTWNGFENVYTNGLVNAIWPAYRSDYLGTGTWFPNQSTVDPSGTFTCGPSFRMDMLYPTDPLIWYDDSGASTGICKIVSTLYADSSSVAFPGDNVTLSGMLQTNTLVAPYKDNAVAFIKEFDANWAFIGISSLNLNTLTNGQPFSVSYGAVQSGAHIQWGIEWAGPPARNATVESLGSVVVVSNSPSGTGPTTVNVSIDPSKPWNGYRNLNYQGGGYWRGDYFPPGSAGVSHLQASISAAGIAVCAPDISMDTDFHTDLNAWLDDSGSSAGICNVVSTFYIDSSTIVTAGDEMVFTGTLVTNGLAEPYTNSVVAFIKEFNASFGNFSMSSVNLNTLTNGEQFTVTKTIQNIGGHYQWGFEWSGPPARTNEVASLGYVVLSSNSVVTGGPQILSISPASANVILGSNITFTATATGNGLSYQWKKNGANLVNGPGVSGATSSALALSSVACTQEGPYTLVVSDSGGLKATNSASMRVYNPDWLYFNRALAPFEGYINAFDISITSPPPSGSGGTTVGAATGFGVNPTSLLRASMNTSTDVITLQPNTYVYDAATNTGDPFWIQPDGSANKYLEQDYFISADFLSGKTLTFSGFCSSNSLNAAYTAVAWIKDLNPDWSKERRYDAPLVAGKPFSLTVATIPGNHIQYGFGLFGPGNSATNPITQGAVEVKVYSPLSVSQSGGNVMLSFPTVINHQYTLQYKADLMDATWNNLSTHNGTGSIVTVPDAPAPIRRFYRLSVQ